MAARWTTSPILRRACSARASNSEQVQTLGLVKLASREIFRRNCFPLHAAIFAAAMLFLPAQLPAQDAPPPPPVEEPAEEAYTGPVVYLAEVVARYPHDTAAYTQGLLWHDGSLYESTGGFGQSWVRKVELATGEVLLQSDIPSHHFGEGLALWEDEFVSLTWRNGVIHRWRQGDLTPIYSTPGFPYEGWGITTFEDGLIFSDGTPMLRVIDPETYEVEREIDVTLNGNPIGDLNELEWIDGMVYANVWQTPYIVVIDPVDGAIRKLIDCNDLVREIGLNDRDAVLNGIAWDSENRRLFVTGKEWPTLFEINLVETDARVRG